MGKDPTRDSYHSAPSMIFTVSIGRYITTVNYFQTIDLMGECQEKSGFGMKTSDEKI